MIKQFKKGMQIAKELKEIESEQGNAARPYRGQEQAVKELIDRESMISYMNNSLHVKPMPLKPGQVGNLWGVGGVAIAVDSILDHMDRAAKRKREKI